MITIDPGVVIIDHGPAMIRYRSTEGREWTVHGICDQRGWCVIGARVHGWRVRDLADYRGLWELLGDRLGFRLDCPVAPGFAGCCPFRFEEG